MKITIVGGGSSYTPEIIDGLINRYNDLKVTEISLTDIDNERLKTLTEISRRMINATGLPVMVTSTQDRPSAIAGSKFIITQIRVGGNRQRATDEKICLAQGVIGQETTGAAGFAKALRTIPAILEIAREVEAVSPNSWIINYTNPSGIVTEAVLKHTKARFIGLCAGHIGHINAAAAALGVEPGRVTMDYFGLNHLAWAYRYYLDGADVTKEVFERLSVHYGVDLDLIKLMKMFPTGYLRWYYHTDEALEAQRKAPRTRGEEVMEIEAKLLEAYRDPALHSKPDLLSKRGGGGYSAVALNAITSMVYNRRDVQIVNTFNSGAISDLPKDAVVEVPCVISSEGPTPLVTGPLPLQVRGLVQAVKAYEQLTIEAAVTGNRGTALMALLSHPLVPSYKVAKALLEELLEASRQYLPQFFKRPVL